MSTKTLSNGTLGLRFMQRAKLAQQVEAEKAQVKDESQWEVSSKVKEAWGLGSGSNTASEVTYEASYLPFLFPSSSEGAGPSSTSSDSDQLFISKGRRKFNGRGHEVVEEVFVAVEVPEEQLGSEDKTRDWSKSAKRPVTISGSSGTVFKARRETKSDGIKPAKLLIHEDSKVGSDLRRPPSLRRPPPTEPAAVPNVFLRPSGVDDPSKTTSGAYGNKPESGELTTGIAEQDIIQGARRKGKGKREQDGDRTVDGELLQGDVKKRKKKKKFSE